MRQTLWIFLAVTGALVLTLLSVRRPSRWPAPEPRPYQGEAAVPTGDRHSEAALGRLVREPQNTWSNLAFVAGGSLLLGIARTRHARRVGVPLIAVGIGSFLYHASASAQLRQLDVGGMYWLFGMTVVLCGGALLAKFHSWIESHTTAALVVTLAAAVALTIWRNLTVLGFKPLSLTVATGATASFLILTLVAVTRRTRQASHFIEILALLSVFAAAVYFQLSDRPGGPLYRPDALVQAHALWHTFAAVAFVWAINVLDRRSPATRADATRPRAV